MTYSNLAPKNLQRLIGELNLSTNRGINLHSTDMAVSFYPNTLSIRFSINKYPDVSYRNLSFQLSRNITSGTYTWGSSVDFQGATYLEYFREEDELSTLIPFQYEITQGSLTVDVAHSGTGQLTFNVKNFDITLKVTSGSNELQRLSGRFIAGIDTVVIGKS
ncbi:hypothetical protein [Pseudomonas sp. A34-9]|uniref:hypothetical protein n=1 Tax=Pseudomonas sp. A34-9 TaxID=3034675 RepID=UPI00240D3C4F|nr:hypothetical protein [Pseudomonas sp. A34-9]